MDQQKSRKPFLGINSDGEKKLTVRNMKKTLARGKRVLALCLLAAVLLLTGSAGALAATSGLKPQDPVQPPDGDPDAENAAQVIEEGEFEGTLLGKTSDAGEQYLKETLFIGDSNTLRMYMFGLLTLQNIIGVEGMGISGALNSNCVYFYDYASPVTIYEGVQLLQPRRVILCFGTNDLMMRDTDWFIKNYRQFIEGLQKAYPYTDVIVASIPPFSKSIETSSFNLETRNKYNRALVEMCEEIGVSFIDTASAVTDKNGYVKPSYIYEDGLHLSETALKELLSYVRTHALEGEDRRPKPLKTIPNRKPAPVIEVPKFDATKITSAVLTALANDGFTLAKKETDMSGAEYTSITVPKEALPGEEEGFAIALYEKFMEREYTGGYVSAGYSAQDNGEIIVSVAYKSIALCATHTFGEWVIKTQPTCGVAGSQERKCSVCNHVETQAIPATGAHIFGAPFQIQPAACTTAEILRVTCTICGHHHDTAGAPALGHDYDVDGHCTRCGVTDPDLTPPGP